MDSLNMSHFLDGVDTANYVANLTDTIRSRSELVCSPVGFYLHRVKIKRNTALVKVYNGLSPKAITPAAKKEMFTEIMRGLAFWSQFCRSGTTSNFANILGWCDSVDSVLPCPVYQESIVAKDYLQKQKDINLMNFLLGIAKGLDYLHSLGYSHGDMRADNIFVDADGEPKITDFGLPRIRLLLEKIGLGADPDNDISAIRWMPVEFIQLGDEAIHEPTKPGDVWSFGMTMFELWSGKVPYHETKLELVPLKINRGLYPVFPAPGVVKHEFEALRGNLRFLCGLCWKKSKEDRKNMQELVHILRELVEGKDLEAIREEFEVERMTSLSYQQSSVASSANTPALTADSRTSDFTEQKSFRVVDDTTLSSSAASSPSSNSSQSNGTVKMNSHLKVENHDDTVSLSDWSHSGGGDGGPQRTNASRPDLRPHAEQAAHPPQASHSPAQNNGSKSFGAFPLPPSPDTTLGEIGSNKTALFNYMIGHRKSTPFKLITNADGEPHLALWTSICLINGVQYGRSANRNKKKAEDEASRQALMRLRAEDPSVSDAFPSYLSKFKLYLAENGLAGRVQFSYEDDGVDHMKTWKCELIRDGVTLASGVGSRKQDAAEQAARNAVSVWTHGI